MIELIGWTSSAILVLTLSWQVRKQWREGRSEGVSRWLFVGQTAASTGFVVYSWLVGNWVFVVTNALILVDALFGAWLVFHQRSRAERRADGTRTPVREQPA